MGRTVWRRETWDIPAADGPACAEAAASWARDLGLPRRVFALSPRELKPIYIDFDSPVLTRILCRQLRRAAAGFPGRPVRFTEMLPEPDDCWLADEHGRHYTSELRLVAVDLGRRASGRAEPRGGQDGGVGQGPLVGADALGESVAQVVVSQQGRAAVGVVDDRDLEVGPSGPHNVNVTF